MMGAVYLGFKRDEPHLRARAVNAKPRADRNNYVVQTLRNTGAGASYVRTAQDLARQGLVKSHAYGASAVGASPSTTSQPEAHLAHWPLNGSTGLTASRRFGTRCW